MADTTSSPDSNEPALPPPVGQGRRFNIFKLPFLHRLRSILTRGGLQNRVLRGGAWLVVADVTSRASSLIKMAILARLLAPKDFGVIGVANMVISWFDYFSQTGFSLALVRKQGDISSYLNTFWTIQWLRGCLLAGGVFLIAPLMAWMFHTPEVIPIMRVMALVLILRGLANPAVVYLRRELRLEREVLWRIGGSLTGLIVAIPLAFIYRNVWALALSVLAAGIGELVLSYVLVKYGPRIELNWAKAREMTRFGKWIFWANLAVYFNLYADSWIIGRVLGTTSVGYYQLAQQFGATPMYQGGLHIAAVTFPAFAQIQDPLALRRAFIRSFRFVSIILLPAAAMLAVFSSVIVRFVLGAKWMAVAPLMAILACGAAIMALGSIMRTFLQAINRPRLATQATFMRAAIFLALVYPLMRRYDLSGVAVAAMFSSLVSFCYQYYEAIRALGSGWDLVKVFRHALVGCLPFFAAAALLPFAHQTWTIAAVALLALSAFAVFFFRQLRVLL